MNTAAGRSDRPPADRHASPSRRLLLALALAATLLALLGGLVVLLSDPRPPAPPTAPSPPEPRPIERQQLRPPAARSL